MQTKSWKFKINKNITGNYLRGKVRPPRMPNAERCAVCGTLNFALHRKEDRNVCKFCL